VRRLDRFIRDQRINQAVRFIRPGSRVLDIGCHDGALFRAIGPALREGVGIDPDLAGCIEAPNYRLSPGSFPFDAPDDEEQGFDAVCALAVFEHIEAGEREKFAAGIARVLAAGGDAILTVPAPTVDGILDLLIRLRVIDGMEVDQHHGFDVNGVASIFEHAGLRLVRHERFQLGLNHLFTFNKPTA
jgi:cyclopropane fatty-acyl-phospholipid synthase-like methyltransferase